MDRRFFLQMAAVAAASQLVGWRFAGAAPTRPDSPNTPNSYDAIIIGAGLGGLSCATYLARHGFRTLLLEQHYRVGGYATSFPRRAGEREFACEVSLHASALTSESNRAMLEELGVWDQLELAPHPQAWSSRFPGFSLDVPSKIGITGFERLLLPLFPDEAAGLQRYFELWRSVMQDMNAFTANPTATPPAQFPGRFPHLWAIRDKTIGQLVNAHIRNPKARAVLTQSCGYYGLPPSRLAAFYYLCPTGEYLESGGDYIKGTSQALSDALAQSCTTAGGEIRLRTKVAAIITKAGRAVGVRTADGAEFMAKAVICNASAPQVFNTLLGRDIAPADYRARLATLTPSPGSCIVWLGLDQDVTRQLPEPEVSFYPGEDMEANYAAAMAGDFEHAHFSMMIYDDLVPGFSPAGCSTIGLVCLSSYDHWKPFEAGYLAGHKEAYVAEKRRLTDILIHKAETLALPGLSKMVVMRDASTPLTNLRFTQNAFGSIYGYAPTTDNVFMTRIANKTPVPGLYLASAWGSPGGGYTGVLLAGKQAFKDVAEALS